MLILGIETSCDDTCVALVKNGKEILSNIVSSQAHRHKLYQGVVPEIASREHVKLFLPTLDLALTQAKVKYKDIDAIAVTTHPGLSGSLMTGLQAAKSLAFVWEKPLILVNHLMSHFYALNLSHGAEMKYPSLNLLVSGGHTMLNKLTSPLEIEVLSTTNDDACGECFDKIAKHYHLGFPGGPAIEKSAEKGDSQRYDFPVSSAKTNHFFSYSGLKTAVAHHSAKYDKKPEEKFKIEDLAASFQRAACRELVKKSMILVDLELKKTPMTTFGICGGVAANTFLREMLSEHCQKRKLKLLYPPPSLCTDNAAMVAGIAHHLAQQKKYITPKEKDFFSLKISPKKIRKKGVLK